MSPNAKERHIKKQRSPATARVPVADLLQPRTYLNSGSNDVSIVTEQGGPLPGAKSAVEQSLFTKEALSVDYLRKRLIQQLFVPSPDIASWASLPATN